MKKVKILMGEFSGCEFEGYRYYCDYLHTGNSPDLYIIKTPEGEMTVTSDKIDISHYEAQLLDEELTRLGAKVGDTVKIIRSGGGYFKNSWDSKIPHKITRITPSGYVQFDDGMGEMFRPDVEVI
ncbi:hypothetical protein [Aminipila terrae]|uniref:Uncharacterized protein n=1 Tax=Aminipila terrae TaxID=2697030 RepID=A0A6P1MJ92_9FIRM|nr:hypothetical protein [Aminipila terrae]QHI73801.1 hypothetical protein Ami3637_16690 [Aminipila terrae]